MKAFLGIARAKFLLLPVTLVAVGAAAAAYNGTFHLIHTLLALVGLTAMHVSVNSLNEHSDFRHGIDLATERTPFSGGSGTLPSGALPASAALYLGLVAALLGLGIGIYFFSQFGLVLLPIFVLGYSDLLARAYVGEIFAGLGLGSLPVLGTAMVQGGELGIAAVGASIPPFFMTFNLLLLNEFPDEKADQEGGRRNLVRLLGRAGAARAYVILGWAVPVCLVVAVAWGALPAITLLACLPSLALIAPTRWALTSPLEPVPLPALGANVVWNLATNTVLAICLGVALILK